MSARSLTACLESDGGITRLSAHAARLMKLQRAYEKSVPAALARHGRVANLKLGVIVIHAENGAVATKIRQVAPRLTDVFKIIAGEVSEIQVKVQPLETSPGLQKPFEAPALEERIKEGLGRLANDLPEDSPLKRALNRLTGSARIKSR